jgi:hypothetical protein
MPRRRSKVKIEDVGKNIPLLQEIYSDAFKVKSAAMKAMRSIAMHINYEDKTEVITFLPLIKQQMDIINNVNDTMIVIQTRLDGDD